MGIARLQVAIAADSLLPRDAMVITPHFKVTTIPFVVGADWDALADDLAQAVWSWIGGDHQVTVDAYDAEGPPPHFPLGHAVAGSGAAPASGGPRELAVCLSYYAGVNRAGHRGRLYVPATLIGGSFGLRPSSTIQTKVGSLVPILADLGGVNVDWCLWSRTRSVGETVTNWWVDDEWDVIRSRGLRPTSRTSGTTSG